MKLTGMALSAAVDAHYDGVQAQMERADDAFEDARDLASEEMTIEDLLEEASDKELDNLVLGSIAGYGSLSGAAERWLDKRANEILDERCRQAAADSADWDMDDC